jgi:hypothetical protein
MLINRYFDDMFHSVPRIPSRLVRYGIIYGGSAKDALAEFEPRFDATMKAQAEKMVEKLQAFIECCEQYEEATVDGPTADDDAKAAGNG